MEREIRVSVIIPVYQVENYLERAIDSVLAQTLEETEIILVDDGSRDESPEICDDYGRKYPDQIRVIHKRNEGLGMARNTGIEVASGKYVAFLDSDDTVEPEMYEVLWKKAEEGQYDMVMCDVNIIYVAEGRSSIVRAYSKETIDIPDYIAYGNNITYSVNKLYRREIWEENRYEKMLFEDIALIPALVTRYPNIGYVSRPFYNYYRRENTISTSTVGAMVDIVQAFRNFIETSRPEYREEVIYNTARQLYWNMTQSRPVFLADFIGLLKEYEGDFRLNPYLLKDKNTRKLLDYLDQEVIPDRILCVHLSGSIPEGYRAAVEANFPKAELLEVGTVTGERTDLPESVQRALKTGELSYAEEYLALELLYENGGIVAAPEMRVQLNMNRLRLNRLFFGFEDDEAVSGRCFGAVKGHYLIRMLLRSYEGENIFNKALLPLGDRIRDFLILHFGLKPNGRNQFLKEEVRVYLPSILAFDMKDGENCCKRAWEGLPENYEAVSSQMLKFWSDRLMENWNLYKQALNRKEPGRKILAETEYGLGADRISRQEMEKQIREVIGNYENSTSWRLTKPVRWIGRLIKGQKGV